MSLKIYTAHYFEQHTEITMKFLPTIDATDSGTYTAIAEGRLKLQVGQWIRFQNGMLSRFVCVRKSGTIWAIHPTGGKINRGQIHGQRVDPERFSALCKRAREV